MADQVRIEIGFDGGQSLSMLVSTESADELDERHRPGRLGDARGGRRAVHRRAAAGRLPAPVPPRGEGGIRGRVTRASTSDACRERDSGRGEAGLTGSRPHPPPRRARAAGRPRRARRAVPHPLRPHLQLPAHERRQPPRRGGPDDADVPQDARVDRQVPLPRGALLGLALPDRAQPRDGSLPRRAPLAAGGGGARADRLRRSSRPRTRRCTRSASSRCSS